MGSKVEESSLLSVYRRELMIKRAKAIHAPGQYLARMWALTGGASFALRSLPLPTHGSGIRIVRASGTTRTSTGSVPRISPSAST
jgi:hypothetical protein